MTLIRASPIKKGNYYTYNKLDLIYIYKYLYIRDVKDEENFVIK